jgi:hypothetical protein
MFACMLGFWTMGASIWTGRLFVAAAFVDVLISVCDDYKTNRIRRATERHHQQLRDEFLTAMRELRRTDRTKGDDT